MKVLLLICSIAAASFAWAGEKLPAAAPASAGVKGEVLEVKDVESYTYLRLKTQDGETWAAVPTAPVKKGAAVTIENSMVMTNFESKSLKQTFKKIVFGSLAGTAPSAPAGGKPAAVPAGHPAAAAVDTAKISVAKATGANAHTVAEVMTKSAALKNKPVVVRGKVVKVNNGIMGKNWVHLQDGTGSAANNSNDLLVTTMDQVKPGDVLVAKGVVRTDKDFGMGYSYKVLVEEATLKP